MARWLLPLLLALLGGAGGIGAGLALRPDAEPAEAPADAHGGGHAPEGTGKDEAGMEPAGTHEPGSAPMPGRDRPPIDEVEFVRLTNQFVVPVLREGKVRALVVVSLGLEVRAGLRSDVHAREPKLRDAFLQVMFDHANAGGFDRTFTASPQVEALRQGLWEAAQPILGADVFDVLITDMARQDV